MKNNCTILFQTDLCLKKGMIVNMEKNQKINCTVNSCKYNDENKQKCKLEQIVVEPMEQTNTQEPDESMCGSYEYGNNQ